MLIVSALISVAISFVNPGLAMLGYLFNAAQPVLARWFLRPSA